MLFLAPLLALAITASAAELTLTSPRLSITSSDGSQLRSEPISLVQKAPTAVLSPTDKLKITFQIVDKESGDGVQPHQTFLRFFDPTTGEEGIQPMRVTPGGKSKFELNMSKPPLSLPPTNDTPLELTLLIGSPSYSPLKVELFDLTIPASQRVVQHPEEASYHLLPEIQHTFRPDPKLPPTIISGVFAVMVASQWFVLLALWTNISPRIPRIFSPTVLPFTATLGAFEGLLFWYWVDLKLGQVLAYGALLSVVTFFAGKRALASIADKRLGK